MPLTTRPQRPAFRPAVAAAGWCLLLALLAVPTLLAQPMLSPPGHRLTAALATLGLLGVLLGLAWLLPWRPLRLLLAPLLAACVFVRLLHYGIARFAGIGFGAELFLHMQPEALRVALLESPLLLVFGLLLVVAVLAGAIVLVLRTPRVSPLLALGVLVIGALLLVSQRELLPEWRLAVATQEWFTPRPSHLAPEREEAWQRSGLVEPLLAPKALLTARAPQPARNLILVYIEAGGLPLTEVPAWPGLMPHLAQLRQHHSLVPYLHTSSYITIEGIVNSQCGTLFPFDRGSDSLLGSMNLADDMACLGDVLAAAGYRQSYLGGASLEFAGKGDFLAAHGYQRRFGAQEWSEIDLVQRPGTWGVSDADLFEQATLELARLREEGGPFNLTLLTIGTHLPGFAYEECDAYGDGSRRFLNAVHCTDQLLHRWISRLEAEGQLDDSVLVITGDHHIFPSAEMRELFGDDIVYDRRLPLIVLGAAEIPPGLAPGAGYDLAPTVLDLLGVQHDARFALGRSLLRERERPGYFVTRYTDVQDGRAFDNEDDGCDPDAVGEIRFPLDRCGKRELMTLLAGQVQNFSQPEAKLDCTAAAALDIRVPADAAAPTEIRIGGVDRVAAFSWRTRPADPLRPGLFVASIDGEGHLLDRQFFAPEDSADGIVAEKPDLEHARAWFAVWRAGGEDAARPPWLPADGVDTNGAWLFAADGTLLQQAMPLQDGAQQLALGAITCARALGGN